MQWTLIGIILLNHGLAFFDRTIGFLQQGFACHKHRSIIARLSTRFTRLQLTCMHRGLHECARWLLLPTTLQYSQLFVDEVLNIAVG